MQATGYWLLARRYPLPFPAPPYSASLARTSLERQFQLQDDVQKSSVALLDCESTAGAPAQLCARIAGQLLRARTRAWDGMRAASHRRSFAGLGSLWERIHITAQVRGSGSIAGHACWQGAGRQGGTHPSPVSRQLVTANEVARICKTRSHMEIVPKKILPDAFSMRRASRSPETINWPLNPPRQCTRSTLTYLSGKRPFCYPSSFYLRRETQSKQSYPVSKIAREIQQIGRAHV